MKRMISLLLTAAMLLGMLSICVFADDEYGYESGSASAETTDILTYNGTTMKAYRAWSTVDSRWATMSLGTGGTATVKNNGSLVVALTKVMIQSGLWKDGEKYTTAEGGKTVADLVELLNSKNCFTSSGALYWTKAGTALGLKYSYLLTEGKYNVADELTQIMTWVKSNYHVLISVETTYGSHWLAVDEGMTLGMNDGEIYVMDGDPSTNIDRYPLLTDYTYIKQICAYTGGTTHAHNLQKEVHASTCTESGYTYYVCPVDDEGYYTDHTDPLGHSYNDVVTQPTCTEQGYTTHTCTRCGETATDTFVPAKGHTSTSVVTAPTCTEKGYTTYTCTVCGYTYQDNETAALGHNYVKTSVVPATETTSGYTVYTCSRCGDSYHGDPVDPHTHEYGNWKIVTGSTATTYGTRGRTCSVCGYMETETLKYLNPFTDLEANSYYYYPVLWAAGRTPQITTGKYGTIYAPNETCTRAQVVTFLYRANNQPATGIETSPFEDVQKTSAYYYKAVLWGYENNIVTGMTATTFEPDTTVTRGQFITFLWRMAGEPTSTVENPFTDLKETAFYYKAVLWGYEKGIVNGMTKTTFEPASPCTRGQVATFLYRYYGE